MDDLPILIQIEPTQGCNLRCRMCHVSYMPDEPRKVFDAALISQLDCLRGRYVTIGSVFEPMMHPRFVDIIRGLNALDCRLELTTNGTLLEGDAASVLADARLETITTSFDGIRRETYEHIRRGANHAQTLQRIQAFRSRLAGGATTFAVNSTMMRSNVEELEEIADYWERAEFDLVRYLVMVVRESDPALVRESLYPLRHQFFERLESLARDVLLRQRRISISNAHFEVSPLRQEFPQNVVDGMVTSDNSRSRRIPLVRRQSQIGARPGMWFPCVSPWNAARILASGDVQLCYQFIIGNLHETSFEDIWFGPLAQRVRERVQSERPVCEKCDYFRLCLNSQTRSLDATEDYIAGYLLEGLPIQQVDFEQGILPARRKASAPRLVETVSNCNIVAFQNRYFGLPFALGPIDLESMAVEAVPGIFVGDTVQDVRRLIRSSTQEALVALGTVPRLPELLETIGSYNLVRLDRQFIGLPQALGPVDLTKEDAATMPGALIATNLSDLRELVWQTLDAGLRRPIRRDTVSERAAGELRNTHDANSLPQA